MFLLHLPNPRITLVTESVKRIDRQDGPNRGRGPAFLPAAALVLLAAVSGGPCHGSGEIVASGAPREQSLFITSAASESMPETVATLSHGSGPVSGTTSDTGKIEPEPEVLTTDIQAGIDRHIAEQTALGSGVFRISDPKGDLCLKLVRIHFEYLATVGPDRHFACVDMVAEDGTFYDVDFFLEGKPGKMRVTETTVHKVNGRPLYVWKEKAPKNWVRVDADTSEKELLGVRHGKDRFVFRYQATLPTIATAGARVWLPIAGSTPFQTVASPTMTVPGQARMLSDTAWGNRVLFLELGSEDSGRTIEITYPDVERVEVAAYPGDPTDAARWLAPDRRVPLDERFRALAAKLTDGKKDVLMKARALYDHVIDRMAYKRCGEGWGQGDAVRACSTPAGNCTDFHSYFIALARSAGIPARFVMGAAIPSERDEGGVDGYHCWAEFYAEGKWWPVDISEGNKFTSLSMYYFGHHPANRFEFTIGRDLTVDPSPSGGPINFLAYPLIETGGTAKTLPVRFSFKRVR